MPNEPDLPVPPGVGTWGPPPAPVTPPIGWGGGPPAPPVPPTPPGPPSGAPFPGQGPGVGAARDQVGELTIRPRRRGPARVLVVVLVAAVLAGAAFWWSSRDTFDGPSPEEDRAAMVRALRSAAGAASLVEVPDAVRQIEDVSVVADRGGCDGAPQPPPSERAAATMAYAPPELTAVPLTLAAGAFSFTSEAEARSFADSVEANLPVCARSTGPVPVPPEPAPDGVTQSSQRITVELAGLAGLAPELQLSVARRGRVVAVVAGIDAVATDRFAAAVAAEAGGRLAGN